MLERLQKIMSESGLCSRRSAEAWILAGRVTVNGHTAALGERADPDRDDIRVDGRVLPRSEEKRYLMLNKPRGYVTTLSDEKDRRTVAELVKDCGARVYPVGRLDYDSEGLLLLTNDGEWMQRILHPGRMVEKEYLVTCTGDTLHAAERLAALRSIGGEAIAPARVRSLQHGEESALLSIVIHEGKNRQIRRMCAACDLEVKRLKRIPEGALTLGRLKRGAWRHLTQEEIIRAVNAKGQDAP